MAQFLPLTAVGDGREGYPDKAPFDAIHVGAAAPHVPPAVSVQRGLLAPLVYTKSILLTLTYVSM